MNLSANDLNTLRTLAGEYAAIAHQDVMAERMDRYYRLNDLEQVRPILLINEVPWTEIRDDFLECICAPELRGLESRLRTTIYQHRHFPVDHIVPSTFRVGKRSRNSGIGLEIKEEQLKSTTGSDIRSHAYQDQLSTEADLAKLHVPEITFDRDATEQSLGIAKQVFDGLMDVKLVGTYPSYNIWDVVARFRGVEAILMDLAIEPDFMHQTAQKFCDIAEGIVSQQEKLGLLDNDLGDVHCTVAHSRHLPNVQAGERVLRQHTWGRCAAQIFGDVSPAMHDEFDLVYNQKIFGTCAHLYYGCCEPLDRKIDILEKRFPNLRKISITPWADAENAARNMGNRFVMAAKPNPANVAMPKFNPKNVKDEISKVCRACKENNTPLEFVLKDISTISNNPQHLTDWAEVARRTIDEHYA